MGKLFGTDGVRGIANKELTCELATEIGRVVAYVLLQNSIEKPKVIIGKDTRISSNMLEMALASGLCSVGVDVVLLGFVPTPAVAYLVKNLNAAAGIMISASHNSFEFNGIKIFNSDGFKLPDSIEDEIETLIFAENSPITLADYDNIGNVFIRHDYVNRYVDHVISAVDTDLVGMKIALDCANGAATHTAKQIFTKLGADCIMLHSTPNGININNNCGSTHMEELINFVNANDIDLGLAFDGDADRCLAVDQNGKIIDGDKLIAVFALDLKQRGELKDDTAVITVMSNFGFKHFARNNCVKIVETTVGDRYVLEEMQKNDYKIGGEQSGHIIFKDIATTGDGQLTGAMMAAIMKRSAKTASELAEVMETFPQILVNVTADSNAKEVFKNSIEIKEKINSVTKVLGDSGRILVRASGTEPLIRVMIEGKKVSEIKSLAKDVAEFIKERISL